jgi:endonuclease/exonuclease/phosphatase family metal-dependent hydrolase
MTLLRVLTYNILLGGRRGQPLHDVVRAVAPDVLLVNESPKLPVLWRRDCDRLVRRWELRRVAGGRPAGSNLIAVAPGVGVKSASAQVIPQPFRQPRRGVAAAQLRVAGRLVGVVSCHLSLVRESRPRELDVVLRAADGLRGPVVLAGDLNEVPTGPSWERLRAAGFVDHGSAAWRTFPASAPDRRIDALLLRGAATVTHHGDPGVDPALLAAASDHRPVLAEIDLG